MKKRGLGITLSYTNTFLNMLTGLFLSSFLLKQLGDNYGVYQTIASFANYLVLLEFGTGTIMSRNISLCRAKGASKEEIEKNISTIWSITNILALAITIASAVFYFSLDYIYAKSLTPEQIADGKLILIFITIYLLASFYVQTINGIMLGNENYPYSSATSIIRIIIRTALLTALVLKIKQAVVIAIVDASLCLMLAIFGYIYASKKYKVKINFKGFDKLILKSTLPMCLAIFLQTLINQANSNVGKFILGVVTDPATVNLYAIGLYVYSLFSSLATIPVSMYMPQVTKDVVAGAEGLELTKKLVQPSRLIIIVSGSIFFGFISAGRQFIDIVYGKEYMLAWIIAIILIFPSFLNMTTAMGINVLDVKNKRLARSLILTATTMLNIILTIFFIKWFGVVGAAISTCICIILGNVIIMGVYYQRVIGIRILYLYYKTYKGILIYQIIGAVAGYFVGELIKTSTIISFLAAGCVYVLIAFGGFLLFGKNEYEKQGIKKIINKIKSKLYPQMNEERTSDQK